MKIHNFWIEKYPIDISRSVKNSLVFLFSQLESVSNHYISILINTYNTQTPILHPFEFIDYIRNNNLSIKSSYSNKVYRSDEINPDLIYPVINNIFTKCNNIINHKSPISDLSDLYFNRNNRLDTIIINKRNIKTLSENTIFIKGIGKIKSTIVPKIDYRNKFYLYILRNSDNQFYIGMKITENHTSTSNKRIYLGLRVNDSICSIYSPNVIVEKSGKKKISFPHPYYDIRIQYVKDVIEFITPYINSDESELYPSNTDKNNSVYTEMYSTLIDRDKKRLITLIRENRSDVIHLIYQQCNDIITEFVLNKISLIIKSIIDLHPDEIIIPIYNLKSIENEISRSADSNLMNMWEHSYLNIFIETLYNQCKENFIQISTISVNQSSLIKMLLEEDNKKVYSLMKSIINKEEDIRE